MKTNKFMEPDTQMLYIIKPEFLPQARTIVAICRHAMEALDPGVEFTMDTEELKSGEIGLVFGLKKRSPT